MSKNLERGIVIVGSGGVGKTTPIPKDNVVVIGNETKPIPFYARQINFTPYWDGQSARNKRRLAERNAKKKRK